MSRWPLLAVLVLAASACSTKPADPERLAEHPAGDDRVDEPEARSPDRATPPSTRDAPKGLGLPDGRAELTVVQRTSRAIPGSGGKILITIGDITHGRTTLSIASAGGETIHAPVSVSKNERVEFSFGARRYVLTVAELRNALIGQDAGVFVIEPARSQAEDRAGDSLNETEKIERLIQRVARMEDAVFIRNGEAYGAEAAAEHMRDKWEWKRDEIRTAREFIEKAASESSFTGSPYKIRFEDGREVSSRAFLLSELSRIEQR